MFTYNIATVRTQCLWRLTLAVPVRRTDSAGRCIGAVGLGQHGLERDHLDQMDNLLGCHKHSKLFKIISES